MRENEKLNRSGGSSEHVICPYVSRAIEWAKSLMVPERFQHSLRVAETSRILAQRFGADPEKAYLAGILHDITRDFEPLDLLRMVEREGIILRKEEVINPIVLHGKAAAVLSKKSLGLRDADILRAISSHVTGRRGWTRLEQVLYLADKVEPRRDYPGVEAIRSFLERGDFLGALQETLANSIIYVVKNHGLLDLETVVVFNEVAQIKGI